MDNFSCDNQGNSIDVTNQHTQHHSAPLDTLWRPAGSAMAPLVSSFAARFGAAAPGNGAGWKSWTLGPRLGIVVPFRGRSAFPLFDWETDSSRDPSIHVMSQLHRWGITLMSKYQQKILHHSYCCNFFGS